MKDYLKTSYTEFINYKNSSGSPIDFLENDNWYFLYLTNNDFKLETSVKKNSPVIAESDQEDFENNYKNLPETNSQTSKVVDVKETTPFAKPDYRTKREAIANWVTCPENASTNIDYLISEERFVSGGEIIFKNAKEGDWISAEVYDKDGVVPTIYRPAIYGVAEDWPTIAKYMIKKWLIPTDVDKYAAFTIDTYPLNAQIPPNFYLRVTYHASNVVGDRKCVVNYHLTKKL